MCGITGLIYDGGTSREAAMREALRAMTGRLRHRGPDAMDFYFGARCMLGHARLSIVDIQSGAQPMVSADGSRVLVFNGEIYGFKEIRQTLSYPYRTESDTEVLLALYDRYGVDMLAHLPGMFAFALWDEGSQQLFAARDRFGEKPFFYAIGANGEFLFASEIKAILESGLVKPEVDRKVLNYYFRNLYLPPDRTIYANIHTLPPAHSLSFRRGKITVERYWRFPEIESKLSLNEAAEQLAHLARRSVQNQLVADVPVGAFLSGGLDSSTIVALASEFHRGIKTFSFGFEGNYNEHSYAKEIADRYATDHYELSATDHDIASLLGEMQDIYDEPFGDSSNIPTYLISKLARKHVTVALSGDAGDELFGGYGFWYTPLAAMEGKKRASFAQDTAVRIVARTAAAFKWKSQAYWSRCRTDMDYRCRMKSIVDAHLHKPVLFNDQELRSLLGEDFKPRPFTLDAHWKKSNTVNDALKMDLEDYLPGDILVKTDRASMANSLELRAPFLDVGLAEFAIALPSRLKIGHARDPALLCLPRPAASPRS